jgi:hypothetical protein
MLWLHPDLAASISQPRTRPRAANDFPPGAKEALRWRRRRVEAAISSDRDRKRHVRFAEGTEGDRWRVVSMVFERLQQRVLEDHALAILRTAQAAGKDRPCAAEEEAQKQDRITDVDIPVVVHVPSVVTRQRRAAEKEVVEDDDRVGDLDDRIVVAIAADEVAARRTWSDEAYDEARDEKANGRVSHRARV